MNDRDSSFDFPSFVVDLVHRHPVCTDIQVEEDAPVVFRGPSGWSDAGFGIAAREDISAMLARMDPVSKGDMGDRRSLDRTVDLSNSRLRCNAYRISAGQRLAISIRVLPKFPMSIEDTGLPPQAGSFARAPKGLLLVSGATGAGKTTTLAALIDAINETRPAHIITIEDPIEYVFVRKKSIITQRAVGMDTESFPSGLAEALRQRPDVIMIGEIRDGETAETALRAAESGHFVMATVHARSAVGALQRMIGFFPEQRAEAAAAALSGVLTGVLAQALVPSIDGKYHLAVEMILNADPNTATMIGDTKRYRQLEEALARDGLKSGSAHMNTVLGRLVATQRITAEAAVAASYSPHEMRLSLSSLGGGAGGVHPLASKLPNLL